MNLPRLPAEICAQIVNDLEPDHPMELHAYAVPLCRAQTNPLLDLHQQATGDRHWKKFSPGMTGENLYAAFKARMRSKPKLEAALILHLYAEPASTILPEDKVFGEGDRSFNTEYWLDRQKPNLDTFDFQLAVVLQRFDSVFNCSDETLFSFDDLAIAYAATSKYADSFYRAGAEQQQNLSLALLAVRKNPEILESIAEPLRQNYALNLAAVQSRGGTLSFVRELLRQCRALNLAALQEDGYALFYVRGHLRQDYELNLAAVMDDGGALTHVEGPLRLDPAINFAAVRENGRALKYVKDNFSSLREITRLAVLLHDDALNWMHSAFRYDLELHALYYISHVDCDSVVPSSVLHHPDFKARCVRVEGQVDKWKKDLLRPA